MRWLLAPLAVAAAEDFAAHAAARLAREERACGPWVGRVLERRGPSLVYERAPTGLADIFSAMLTALWSATLSGRRLAVHWPESAGTVHLGGREVRRRDAARLAANATYFKRTHEAFREALRAGAAGAVPWPGGDPWVVSGNRGLTGWLFDDAPTRAALAAAGVDAKTAVAAAGCALHRLAAPSRRAYRDVVRPLLAALDARRARGPVVCLHARTGLMPEVEAKKCAPGASPPPKKRCARPDDEMHGAAAAVSVADLAGFVACARAAEAAAGGAATWFLAADSASLRRDFLATFGADKVLLAPWAPDPFAAYQHGGGSRGGGRRDSAVPDDGDPDRMRGALGRTFAEWYALSRCDHLVASRSGFSRTAAVVAAATRNATVHYVSRLDASCRRADPGSPTERLLVTGGAGL